MLEIFSVATLWLALAVLSSIIAYHLRISIALVEICVGMIAAMIAERYLGMKALGSNVEWIRFLASAGAVILTFLAGAELETSVIRNKWKEVIIVGMIGFFAPFSGSTLVAKYLLGWDMRASLLAGIALSTTSMAVVYAVMLETGLNKTVFGKGLLGACFINDLGTVLALSMIFAPFTYKTAVFIVICIITLSLLPFLTKHLTEIYANRTAAIRTKWVILVLFGLGTIAFWSGNEAVLPAYIAGMVLAKAASDDHYWIRRFRTLAIGLLTPFYFIRAGSLVSVISIISAPMIFLILFGSKVVSKILGLYPIIGLFREDIKERWYYTLLMSTGLTFGTISALYGLTHEIISSKQYSFLVATVIASAVVPTIIANKVFLPQHLFGEVSMLDEEDIEDIK